MAQLFSRKPEKTPSFDYLVRFLRDKLTKQCYRISMRTFPYSFLKSFRYVKLALFTLIGLSVAPLAAQAEDLKGFQLNRFEATAPGEMSFMVSHPWYKNVKHFAIGYNLDYAFQPWVLRHSQNPRAAIEHMLVGHLGIAWSMSRYVNLNLALPVSFLDSGDTTGLGINTGSIGVNDPRIGLLIRLSKYDPYLNWGSVSLGLDAWLPLRNWMSNPEQAGDAQFRILPKFIFGGVMGRQGHGFLWSLTTGFYYRPSAQLAAGPAAGSIDAADNTMAGQIQIGAALGYTNALKRRYIGLEMMFQTNMMHPFESGYNSLEVLAGFHWGFAKVLTVNAAIGAGIPSIQAVGTPTVRAILGLTVEIPNKKPQPLFGPAIAQARPPVQQPRPVVAYGQYGQLGAQIYGAPQAVPQQPVYQQAPQAYYPQQPMYVQPGYSQPMYVQPGYVVPAQPQVQVPMVQRDPDGVPLAPGQGLTYVQEPAYDDSIPVMEPAPYMQPQEPPYAPQAAPVEQQPASSPEQVPQDEVPAGPGPAVVIPGQAPVQWGAIPFYPGHTVSEPEPSSVQTSVSDLKKIWDDEPQRQVEMQEGPTVAAYAAPMTHDQAMDSDGPGTSGSPPQMFIGPPASAAPSAENSATSPAEGFDPKWSNVVVD